MKAKDRSIKTSRNHKQQLLARSGAFLIGLYFGATCELVLAGPTGGEVVRGEGSIGQSGATTSINQQSHRLSLQWQTFDVAKHENVVFDQPGVTAVALNRILDQKASEILGAIDANGHVFLVNPNGIIFGSTATVNVGALVASSLDINYDDFMAGKYDFQTLADGSPGVVVNRGLLQAATGGSVTLLGEAVSNEGLILAELGQVTLAAGSSASLDFSGDGLLLRG
jgi:filamentous hemagglutinin family protein